jgi:hypothetical protein
MSARTNTKKSNKQSNSKGTPSVTATGGSPSSMHPALRQAKLLIQKNDYTGAANLLAAAGRDPQVRNALGVCLLRTGRIDQAVDVFRSFVLMPGSVMERPDVSKACRRNFATALLMKGFPSGALAVLAEIREPEHIMDIRLRSAIKQWEKSLSWFRRLDWKMNGIEPRNCHVPIDFQPGEFDERFLQVSVDPGNPNNSDPKVAA